MEFLGLPESPRLVESDLEAALLDNLQAFLLELGKGFAFVARQQRLTLDGDHFYIDLVFYHAILKCFVLIDLKTGKLTHQDLGQLQLYVNYYDRERRSEGDNPTLGLILCTDKNNAVVQLHAGVGTSSGRVLPAGTSCICPAKRSCASGNSPRGAAAAAAKAGPPIAKENGKAMNRHVNAIAGRLSLRPPQRRSLEILDRITEIVPPQKGADIAAALATIRSEFPTVTDFEREFPSLCFALATGVGKTRLMGAFISYLHLAHGINNFFVLAPNLTIYNKLIADFTPNTPEVCVQGHRGICHRRAGDHHRRQLRGEGRHAVRPAAALQGQHLQHLENQLRSARRQIAAHQAPVGIHRRKLF